MAMNLRAAVEAGAKLTMEQGPVFEVRPGFFERMVELLLDGEPIGKAVLSWEASPGSVSSLTIGPLD
jgi:hypothetical protein